MKTACFIPIKENSERVPGKNFRILNGKKLYEHIIEHVIEANCFDAIYIDTNSKEICEYANGKNLYVIERLEELAQNTANGNDLLVYHRNLKKEYDYYFQMFATAPFLQPTSIVTCANALLNSEDYDSCFTAIKNNGFYWFNGVPVNYRPGILPRSQDMTPVIEETTGMYGITAESLDRYKCRIGRNPYIHLVDKFEAVDINTEDDLKIAEYIGKVHWMHN
ncbi:cytidylyltransferase domain-containing protein [Treponema pectinovorum]|uniref:acylneuraminate cytidylyltransferase family protein n=1 Tax=Treponema pectinovorum TaxID=164 RepID=UPI0011C7A39A|nr:acylneuraminate cytidylyltransferase family protein [Treponema pectinovorum]